LTDEVLEQVKGYNKIAKCKFVAVSNGIETKYYHYRNGDYKYLANEPSFKDLLREANLQYDHLSYNLAPLFMEHLSAPGYADKLTKDGIIGLDTPAELHSHIANLDNFLMTSGKLSPIPLVSSGIEIIDDLHISAREYGNVSGGSYVGAFRGFLVKDLSGEAQVYRLAVMANAKTRDDPRIGTRRGTTALLVSVDDYAYSVHNALQLSIDSSTAINGDHIEYFHSGVMTVGNKGQTKRNVVLNHISDHYAKYLPITDKGVFLGRLPLKQKLYWQETQQFIINLLLYANIRDNLRKVLTEK
jgi:hypothetical protein